TDSGSWLSDFDLDQKGDIYNIIYNNESDCFFLTKLERNNKANIVEGRLGIKTQNFKAIRIYLVKTDKYYYIIGVTACDQRYSLKRKGKIAVYDVEKKKITSISNCDNIFIEVCINNIFPQGSNLITHDMKWDSKRYNIYELIR
ncbi:MAG: hypothetical protein LWY06_00225, partial [Firmicutes bacterium]|nr:hypothetical protein [Bacillota bacterium]